MADIIVVGGGLAGTVVASRLHQRLPDLDIVLIEAGPDPSDNPNVTNFADGAKLHFSELDSKFMTMPQEGLDGKSKYNCAAKALGGGTVINYGGWTRGDVQDYDEWARNVKDQRWSYNSLLPYFKRCETHHDPNADPEQHGFDGPVHTTSVTSSGREYPLRESVLKLWKTQGLEYKSDLNDGSPQSISDLVESWHDGKRQLTQSVYSLDGVIVRTSTTAQRIILDDNNTATGVELLNSGILHLKPGGQIILSAGAYRTPQLLMLSGIGDQAHLASHGIPVQVDLPGVGQNLHDHLVCYRYWKLRHPERDLALGFPLFSGENYDKGGPADFLVRTTIPSPELKDALEKDVGDTVPDTHALLQDRTHLEHGLLYAGFGAESLGLTIPAGGNCITSFFMSCLPTSRGSVMLSTPSAADAPIIDPNYRNSDIDAHVLRHAFRGHTSLFLDTPEGREIVEEEFTPPGYPVLGVDASDEQIDARIRFGAQSCFHPAGTTAMGSVVDGSLKVHGTEGLRVVDASVIPEPLAAHLQVPIYAIAEQAVDIILEECFWP
ncbi:putative glucose dehydrogenase [Setomelanomma holmii]|uniref:Glucose dehydrogenase n=1 Tax=Setomelanomma holmii TaxID=210430 RepID=A0A9P4LH73_9PLEO|nr:putative glucose dehydrogenase [Setomelanomma holmii]